MAEQKIIAALRARAFPLSGARADFDPLLELIGDAPLVLLGEATHGSHEFYRARAEITRRLIEEKGFVAVAVEADWPDARRVHDFVLGAGSSIAGVEALAGFNRFPQWMWRNIDVLDFVGWLREYNDSLPARASRVGFYGLDLYSLYRSIEAVIAFLERVDSEAAKRARYRYACFDSFGGDPRQYGLRTALGLMEQSCEEQVIAQLVEMQRLVAAPLAKGLPADEEYYLAEQNARVAKNAESYYRAMFKGRKSSWNLRDRHMAETVEELRRFLSRGPEPPKICIWEHNSHVGDARHTEMREHGEINVGQLLRERFGRQVRLIGFTTYEGTVTAAADWETPAERQMVIPALRESYEALLHAACPEACLFDLQDPELKSLLREPRLERAIGVVYLPETERLSHYFQARLSEQFDAVLHYDVTRAVEPLDPGPGWTRKEIPETFPHAV